MVDSTDSFLDYAFVRTEADGRFLLLIKLEPVFINADIDISLNDSSQLVISLVDSNKKFVSSNLPSDLYSQLANSFTQLVFSNSDGQPISSHLLEPLKPIKNRNRP